MLVEALQRSLERRIVAANAVAGLVVLTYLQLTGRQAPGTGWVGPLIVSTVSFVVLLILLAAIAIRLMRPQTAKNTAWLNEGRSPTPEERRAILDAPWLIGLYPLPFWCIAALLICLGPGIGAFADRSRIFVAIVLGGLLSCALGSVLVDRANTELRARALAGAPPEKSSVMTLQRRLVLAWALGSGIPLVGIALTPLVRSSESPVPLAVPVVLLAIVGLLVGLLITSGTASSIAEPMDRLRGSLERVQRGDLDALTSVDAVGEVGMVQAGFNQMVTGLREREQLRDLFGRHVGEDVARAALEQGVSLGGEQRTVSVFFVDLVGSSTLAAKRLRTRSSPCSTGSSPRS